MGKDFHGSESLNRILLGYDTVYSIRWLQMFRKNVPSSSSVFRNNIEKSTNKKNYDTHKFRSCSERHTVSVRNLRMRLVQLFPRRRRKQVPLKRR
jgi:hypothetical protein